ncbi:hypothetical protein HELRODRAFT_184279 [Helobdella robusta]|uniref:Ig-like domain-containing protein n=1 Tax=Helobdella robusta TaxID=6412 RepID=T1FKW8_HELRO|nr:hypothetical protein HELRODRAFT_184279 [Helobdella robusta]ESO03505.1 hypothetical protein HELRODRAFT_184279 [Helobdella robusta]
MMYFYDDKLFPAKIQQQEIQKFQQQQQQHQQQQHQQQQHQQLHQQQQQQHHQQHLFDDSYSPKLDNLLVKQSINKLKPQQKRQQDVNSHTINNNKNINNNNVNNNNYKNKNINNNNIINNNSKKHRRFNKVTSTVPSTATTTTTTTTTTSFTTTTTTTTTKRHIFRFIENQPGRLGCLAISGYPLQPMKITLGHRDISPLFTQTSPFFLLGGVSGLKKIVYRTQIWTGNLSLSADDDQNRVTCFAAVAGLQVAKIEAVVDVVYKPKITCTPALAHLREKNVYIECRIKSKPHYTSVHWSSTSTSSREIASEIISNNAYTTNFQPSSWSSPSPSSPSSSSSQSSPPPSDETFKLTSGGQKDGLWSVITVRP